MSDQNILYRKAQCGAADKAESLLEEQDVEFEVETFADKQEEQAFRQEHDVATTPQFFLKGKRIGGYSELAEYYGEEEEDSSYIPVIAVFASTLLMTLAMTGTVMMFMGLSLSVLAILKLMDIPAFVQGFKQYDLLSKRVAAYAYVYPFAELLVGLGFLSLYLPTVVGLVSVFIGVVGGVSVLKAVYIDKTDLNCACVGGNNKVPLGIISFTENAMMAVMGLWLLYQ
ncbi:MauE/DoxX family redox-associated membrane protein [Lacimicrobium alkaliphilum]|uniref:Methylamine utilization protein MauE n=1 Tax=Lacimicrobium alkaliphilum TaxID=1526571 RepID=A0A0U2JJ50_9ALTE|nr:MauE/DoxX family redox-associated membrane protein [Lacimicrobium alkaliphilum]ALS98854.1 glutaredoxin [Lacimicrobium alkaliphilum]